MRTVKRHSYKLNANKWEILLEIASAYAHEKDKWLLEFSKLSKLSLVFSYRSVRDSLVKEGYTSPEHLQARHWKLALKDAIETLDTYWQGLFVRLRELIYNNTNLNEQQKRYCYWVLKDYSRLQNLLLRLYPMPDHFDISTDELKKAGNYLNRIIRKYKSPYPRVRKVRSFCLDQDMYRVFTKNSTQYIAIMTLTRGKRLIIPLKGYTKIRGNIRIILTTQNQIEVHLTQAVICHNLPDETKIEAIDFGYTEVFTDSHGNHYGEGFGSILTHGSDAMGEKGKKRNKLYALEKKAIEHGDQKKAKRIKKFNLGRKKFNQVRDRLRATIARTINESFNQFFKEKKPKILITENLRHNFTFNGPKKFNRLISFWTKGMIQDRAEFKALTGCSIHKQVNPAYGSQLCFRCGFVWSKNRNGDKFQCQFCGHEDHADRIAALNYLNRYNSDMINLYTPYRQVKEKLLSEFHRRLECWDFEFSPDQVNWSSMFYLTDSWESSRDIAVKAYIQQTVPGRTRDT